MIEIATCEVGKNQYAYTQLPPLSTYNFARARYENPLRLERLLLLIEDRLRTCENPVDVQVINALKEYHIIRIEIRNGNFTILNQ